MKTFIWKFLTSKMDVLFGVIAAIAILLLVRFLIPLRSKRSITTCPNVSTGFLKDDNIIDGNFLLVNHFVPESVNYHFTVCRFLIKILKHTNLSFLFRASERATTAVTTAFTPTSSPSRRRKTSSHSKTPNVGCENCATAACAKSTSRAASRFSTLRFSGSCVTSAAMSSTCTPSQLYPTVHHRCSTKSLVEKEQTTKKLHFQQPTSHLPRLHSKGFRCRSLTPRLALQRCVVLGERCLRRHFCRLVRLVRRRHQPSHRSLRTQQGEVELVLGA